MSVKAELRRWLRWTLWGAVLGALVVGGAGAWFFGVKGLAYGAAAGAAVGGLGAWSFFLYVETA